MTERRPEHKYMDRYGHLHTDAINWAWSPRMREIMGIRPIDEKETTQ